MRTPRLGSGGGFAGLTFEEHGEGPNGERGRIQARPELGGDVRASPAGRRRRQHHLAAGRRRRPARRSTEVIHGRDLFDHVLISACCSPAGPTPTPAYRRPPPAGRPRRQAASAVKRDAQAAARISVRIRYGRRPSFGGDLGIGPTTAIRSGGARQLSEARLKRMLIFGGLRNRLFRHPACALIGTGARPPPALEAGLRAAAVGHLDPPRQRLPARLKLEPDRAALRPVLSRWTWAPGATACEALGQGLDGASPAPRRWWSPASSPGSSWKQRPRACSWLAAPASPSPACWIMGARSRRFALLGAERPGSATCSRWRRLSVRASRSAIAPGPQDQARQPSRRSRSGVVGAPWPLLAKISALLLGEQILPTTLAGLAACAGLGFVHFAGQGSIAWAMGRLPTSLASVVVLVQPVVATYAGFLLFGEALGPLQATLWRDAATTGAERRGAGPMGVEAAACPGRQPLSPLGRQAPGDPRRLDAGQLGVEGRPVVVRHDRRAHEASIWSSKSSSSVLALREVEVGQAPGAHGPKLGPGCSNSANPSWA